MAECIRETGFGFMFAPLYHPAMRHAVIPRREIGIRTVFNEHCSGFTLIDTGV